MCIEKQKVGFLQFISTKVLYTREIEYYEE
jgi:hypothetical protein